MAAFFCSSHLYQRNCLPGCIKNLAVGSMFHISNMWQLVHALEVLIEKEKMQAIRGIYRLDVAVSKDSVRVTSLTGRYNRIGK
ncbi:hypothetical protein KUTeg_020330 [Tegillarca granosa]|uniref:Uncharacterized protein n=1 Tax=Tegillarca granosa TaxID=220873 RepID=A0ABQ9E7J6_TEGGR|nr:hypothetical protein KUTeg_020330 [Tegillarca granosa]